MELDLSQINERLPECYFYLDTTITLLIDQMTFQVQLKRGICTRFWIEDRKSLTRFNHPKTRSYVPYLEGELIEHSRIQIQTWRVAKQLFISSNSYLHLLPNELAIKILELTQCREVIDCNKLLTHPQINSYYTVRLTSPPSNWFHKPSPMWAISNSDGCLSFSHRSSHGGIRPTLLLNNYLRQSEWTPSQWIVLTALWHKLSESNGKPKSNIPPRLTLKELLKQIDTEGLAMEESTIDEDLLN